MSRILPEARTTLMLAIPMILGQVSQMLMGVIDTAMIGQVGTVPLAASSFAGSVFGFFYVSSMGLCVPVAVMVSRARGASQPRECAEWLRHGLALATFSGIVAMVLMELVGRQLSHLGQPEAVVAAAQPFFSLIALSLVPALAFQAFRQFAESLGRPWLPTGIMAFGVVLNVALNWVLIYGNLGAPALGLTGAGVATLTARCVDLGLLWLILKRDRPLHAYWPTRWRTKLEWPRLRELLSIGVPASGQMTFELGAFMMATWMMGWLGTTALAAHQIALSCAAMTFMVPLGLAMASSMRVSQVLGAGRKELVLPIGLGSYGMAFGFMGLAALVFWVGGAWIARQFVDDAEVVVLAGRLLGIAALFQLFDGGQVIGVALLRGLSDMKIPTLITFVAYWCIMLPTAYVWGVRAGNPLGVWQALAFGLAGAALLLGWRFQRKSRASGACNRGEAPRCDMSQSALYAERDGPSRVGANMSVLAQPSILGLSRSALKGRVLVPEILDTLDADSPEARHSRRDLRIFNRVMGNEAFFLSQLRAEELRGVKILEIGAGSGDLARRLQAEGFCVDALDRCPPPADWPADRSWFVADVRDFDRWHEYPVVIANLFLHHLSSAELAELGRQWSKNATLILASEPARRRRFFFFFVVTCILCRANAVSRHDGWASFSAGFAEGELARELGLNNAQWKIEDSVHGRGSCRFSARKIP
ncbi:MAG: MATE family efflux transporter [Nibricoccus sp.]